MSQIPPSPQRAALQQAHGQAQQMMGGPGGGPPQPGGPPEAQQQDPQQVLASHEGRIAAIETVLKQIVQKLSGAGIGPSAGARPPAPGAPPQGPPPPAA